MPNIYITQDELRVHPYNISQDDANTKYLEMLQDLTKKIIDNECQQSFDKEGADPNFVEYRVDGTGKDTVFIAPGKRLLTLSSVRVYVSTNSFNEYTAPNFYTHDKYVSWNTYGATAGAGRLFIEEFPKGSRNIGIIGEWGYETPPEPIKYLQGKLIMKILQDGGLSQKYSAETIGDYNYTLKEAEGEILGDPELDLIIKEYTNWSFYEAI